MKQKSGRPGLIYATFVCKSDESGALPLKEEVCARISDSNPCVPFFLSYFLRNVSKKKVPLLARWRSMHGRFVSSRIPDEPSVVCCIVQLKNKRATVF